MGLLFLSRSGWIEYEIILLSFRQWIFNVYQTLFCCCMQFLTFSPEKICQKASSLEYSARSDSWLLIFINALILDFVSNGTHTVKFYLSMQTVNTYQLLLPTFAS